MYMLVLVLLGSASPSKDGLWVDEVNKSVDWVRGCSFSLRQLASAFCSPAVGFFLVIYVGQVTPQWMPT